MLRKSNINKSLVSVILPVYNISQYIDKCMFSLLSQTYSNYELLLVDDGSTDNSGYICDKYEKKDSRVKVFHKVNGGLSDARNYGIQKAKGTYITCIDPDDYVDPDYIEYLMQLIDKYHTKMSICHHRVHYDNGRIKDLGSQGEVLLNTEEALKEMLYHRSIDTSAWGKLYRKDLFDSVKYPKGKIFEDIGTTYALMLQCNRIAVGYESKYNYVFHNNSIVNSHFSLRKLDMIEMTDKMGTDVVNRYPGLSDAVLRRRVYARFSTLNQMLNTTEYLEIRNQIINFIKNNSKAVFFDIEAPIRDKVAIITLNISYSLYKKIWLLHEKRIMQ